MKERYVYIHREMGYFKFCLWALFFLFTIFISLHLFDRGIFSLLILGHSVTKGWILYITKNSPTILRMFKNMVLGVS